MNRSRTLDRIPSHLRQFVVQQDYDSYDEVDQAVWRFVLLQTYNNLKYTAHPIYVQGLEQTGIFVDHIPHIEEMDQCLNRYDWGAVCVDGFIPPKAFQEFQAHRILTIAADIRTADHLAYTPAPDIIHESAGHAPIIPDADYRHFLQRFGEVGAQAFSSTEDLEIYESIRNLSIVKECLTSTPAIIEAAQARLDKALASVTFTSEAALLSRLHWWTVEYGLIGTPSDYKIYGAGLLSSVGESFFLHAPDVRKIPLDARCVQFDYDITKPQPQLFVVEEFTHLNEVLDRVTETFAFRSGGVAGLENARKSGEVGTIRLNSGLQIIGRLAEVVDEDQPCYLKFAGPCALAMEDRILEGHGRDYHAQGFGSPLGRLEGGTALSECTAADLEPFGYQGPGSNVRLAFASGVLVEGRLDRVTLNRQGRLALLSFNDCRVFRGETMLFLPEWGTFDMAVGESVLTARAGSVDQAFWPSTRFSEKRVPTAKQYGIGDRELVALFHRCRVVATEGTSADVEKVFREALGQMKRHYPDQWLLSWNLLESLKKLGHTGNLVKEIKNFMLEIENRKPKDVPVTMGLKYLGMAS